MERNESVAGDHTRAWVSVYMLMRATGVLARVDGPAATPGERKHGDTERDGYNNFSALKPP